MEIRTFENFNAVSQQFLGLKSIYHHAWIQLSSFYEIQAELSKDGAEIQGKPNFNVTTYLHTVNVGNSAH